MRNLLTVMLVIIICTGCGNIPNKSVFEPLDEQELSEIIKKDTMFANFYMGQALITAALSEVDKAKYNNITYRSAYKMFSLWNDSVAMKPKITKWEKEWKKKFGNYSEKVDSIIEYWKDEKKKNSLNEFVKIELVDIDKEYYSYSSSLRDLYLGFMLTPVQGELQEVKFQYGFSTKKKNWYSKKKNCKISYPIWDPVIRHWEVNILDKMELENVTMESFMENYDIEIEVLEVRKDGVTHNLKGLKIPKSVKMLMDSNPTYGKLYDRIRMLIYVSLIDSNYIELEDYLDEKQKEYFKDKFPRESDYYSHLYNKLNNVISSFK